jgi:hypothetical protein
VYLWAKALVLGVIPCTVLAEWCWNFFLCIWAVVPTCETPKLPLHEMTTNFLHRYVIGCAQIGLLPIDIKPENVMRSLGLPLTVVARRILHEFGIGF